LLAQLWPAQARSTITLKQGVIMAMDGAMDGTLDGKIQAFI
jgi:hypothetical protein